MNHPMCSMHLFRSYFIHYIYIKSVCCHFRRSDFCAQHNLPRLPYSTSIYCSRRYIFFFFCVVRRAGRLLFCCIYFFLASSPLVARAWLYVCMYGDSFSRPYQPESVFEIGLRGQTGAYTAISPINWFCSECAHRAIQPYMHIYKY